VSLFSSLPIFSSPFYSAHLLSGFALSNVGPRGSEDHFKSSASHIYGETKRAVTAETRVSSHPPSSLPESNPKPKSAPRGRKKQRVTTTSATGVLEGAGGARTEASNGPSSVSNPNGKETPVAENTMDPEEDEVMEAGAEELAEAFSRPPPVNSSYLPLPWKGRLGYIRLLQGPSSNRSLT
jgi:hypothetical protein